MSVAEIEEAIGDEIESASRFGQPRLLRLPAHWYMALVGESYTPYDWHGPPAPTFYYGDLPVRADGRLESNVIVEVDEVSK